MPFFSYGNFYSSQNIFPVFHRLQFFLINNNKLRVFVIRNVIAYIMRKNEKRMSKGELKTRELS